MEAENVLSQNLGSGPLSFAFFDDEKVIYETDHGTYIHANYKMNEDSVSFEDIKELVVDHDSQKNRLKECVRKMVESIIDGNDKEANFQFYKYMEEFAKAKKSGTADLNEDTVVRVDNRSGKVTKQIGTNFDKKRAARIAWSKHRGKMLAARRKRSLSSNRLKERSKHKQNVLSGKLRKVKLIKTGKVSNMMKEWYAVANKADHYVTFMENQMHVSEVEVKQNESGDTVAVTLPTSDKRNKGKILSIQNKTLKTDVKVLREAARNLPLDETFCKMISTLKRMNNMSMAKGLQESLEGIVKKYPSVLYLTQTELAKTIGRALEYVNESNYDDQTCEFMAEGILRTAQVVYPERVNRIVSLANSQINVEGKDTFKQFQEIVTGFYANLDEVMHSEMQVYVDLYNTLVEVHQVALESKNQVVREEVVEHLNELKAVVEGKKIASLELAYDVSNWLHDLVESNMEGMEGWDIVDSPFVTSNGDHPHLSKLSKQPGTPGSYADEWNNRNFVSDGKNYKGKESDELESHGPGNKGGNDVWPTLDNPYVPKAFDGFVVKGEKDDVGLAHAEVDSDNTWPGLSNKLQSDPMKNKKVKE
jgi:hypothetical protein